MDSSDRAEIIREGNMAFNEGDYSKARHCFIKAEYHSGLVRLGDYYMFDRRLPLLAYGYYKKAGDAKKIKDLKRRMVGAIGHWIGHDKIKQESLVELGFTRTILPSNSQDEDGMIPVSVSPVLRDVAMKILQGSNN